MSKLLNIRDARIGDADSFSEASTDQFEEEAFILRSDSPTAVERLNDGMKKWFALFLWTFTLVPLLLNLLRITLPVYFGINLAAWSRFVLLIISIQTGTRLMIFSLLKWLRKSDADRIAEGTLEKTTIDIASYIEAVTTPLSTLITTITFAIAWYSVYPFGCVESSSVCTNVNEQSINIGNSIPIIDEDTAAAHAVLSTLSSSPQMGKLSAFLEGVLSNFCVYQFVTDVLLCSIVTNFVLILENILVRMGLWKFLRGNFQERIVEARFRTYVVEMLRKKSMGILSTDLGSTQIIAPILFPFVLPFRLAPFDRLLSWINEGLSDIGPRSFDQIVAGRPLHYNEYRRKFNSWLQRHGIDEAVEFVAKIIPQTDSASKLLAKDIFSRICAAGQQIVTADDFMKIFQGRASTRDAYYIFDRDQDGTVSKTEFRHTCITVYREMRNLASSVNDAASAFTSLAGIIHGLVVGSLFFVGIAIFGVHVQSIFAIILSLVLGLNVVIGDVAKKAFQGVIFLFVDHPYDIGDRVMINSIADSDPLIVHQINMLTTVFHRWNGQEIYASNSSIASTTIFNISRSAEQWERIDFQVSIVEDQAKTEGVKAVVSDKIGLFRDKLESFLKIHATDYIAAYELKPMIAGEVGKSEDFLDVIGMTLRVQCRPTIDSQKRWNRHSKLLNFVTSSLKASGLELQGKLKSFK